MIPSSMKIFLLRICKQTTFFEKKFVFFSKQVEAVGGSVHSLLQREQHGASLVNL